MNNLLVTGGAGFIGSNFIRYELNKDDQIQIVNLDALTYAGNLGNLDHLPGSNRHTFVKGDISDPDLVTGLLTQHNIDTIVHFAAESHVDRSIENARSFIDTNITGTFTLLEAARDFFTSPGKASNFRFHHVSTDEVFGSLAPQEPAFKESTAYSPNSPYAASKAASDHLARAYHHTYGLPVTISNCSNNYGPYQFPEKLVPLIISNATRGKNIPIYGDGMQVRDWLYVEDHCEAIDLILRGGTPGETYNIGGNNQPSNIEIVRTICAILETLAPSGVRYDALIQHVPDRPGHDRRYAMDITKMQRVFGWSPREDLASGMEKTVKWYLQNQDWVKAIDDRPDYQSWMNQNYTARKGEK